jgi:ubiquinone biosynthesis monooxygenase Coq7
MASHLRTAGGGRVPYARALVAALQPSQRTLLEAFARAHSTASLPPPPLPPQPPPRSLPPHVPSFVHGGRAAAERRAVVDEILRVDHAGEAAAVEIYRGQLWALGRGAPARGTLQGMLAGEEEHLRVCTELVGSRRARPSLLLPAWRLGGFALGAATALLGERAAMACTVAVETAISEHYNSQIRELLRRGMGAPQTPSASAGAAAAGDAARGMGAAAGSSTDTSASAPASAAAAAAEDAAAAAASADAELLRVLQKHRDDEIEHHDTALRLGAERAPFYALLTGVIQAGCLAAIAVARRV